jgi:carboxylesterase type B
LDLDIFRLPALKSSFMSQMLVLSILDLALIRYALGMVGVSVDQGKLSLFAHVVFLPGLRFAAAPVGNLRFAPPQPPPAPPAMQRATVKEPSCPQAGKAANQNEDCLFLNVQRPESVPLATRLPVLLHIHGGGFEAGSSKDNDPAALISLGESHDQPVVVVRINYRLGLLGFLAGSELQTARDADSNNVGLNRGFQDMKMAIEWVQSHIAVFGGDPSKITIWGQSAG